MLETTAMKRLNPSRGRINNRTTNPNLPNKWKNESMIEYHIAELMGKHRLNKLQVSEKTGIRPNTVGDYWHGTVKSIKPDHIEAFCKLFNCQPGDLFSYNSDK
jgi:putative transcriptional regulator